MRGELHEELLGCVHDRVLLAAAATVAASGKKGGKLYRVKVTSALHVPCVFEVF